MAEKLEIVITADTKSAERNIGGLTKAFGGLSGLLSGALKIGLAAGAAGIGALASGLAFAISEATEAETVLAQTNAVIKSTGGIAGITAEAASDLAQSLSEVTRFSDEAVLSGENILLTFTNIGQDIFPQATQTILDMSQALGQDLQSSAIQLGKALQDPIQGVNALRRVGVNFTEAQQELIKSLVESGNAAEAQRLILKELQTEFGGSAEAAGQTFAGQLDILKNKFSNLAEEIGGAVLPLLTGGLGELSGAFDKVKTAAEPIISAFKQFVQDVQAGMSPVEAFRNTFGEFIPPQLQDAFNNVLDAFRQLELLLRNPDVQEQLKAIGQALLQATSDAVISNLTGTARQLSQLAALIQENGPAITTILGAVAEAIKIVGVILKDSITLGTGAIEILIRVLRGDFPGALQRAFDISDTILADFVGLFSGAPRQMLDGFVNGIQDQVGRGREVMLKMARELQDAFRQELGIHSPSSVFAEFGKFTMQGLTMGINANATMPQAAVAGAAGGLVSTAYNSSQQNFYSPNIFPQTMIPSIDEVLDQFNVSSGRG